MSTVLKKRYTSVEYLALERAAEFKSEYLNGEILAMTGASRQHARIAGNLIAGLDKQLRDTPCEAFGSDLRVKISATELYTYPCLTIADRELQFEDEALDTLLN